MKFTTRNSMDWFRLESNLAVYEMKTKLRLSMQQKKAAHLEVTGKNAVSSKKKAAKKKKSVYEINAAAEQQPELTGEMEREDESSSTDSRSDDRQDSRRMTESAALLETNAKSEMPEPEAVRSRLQEAVLWAEILGEPVSRKRRNERADRLRRNGARRV